MTIRYDQVVCATWNPNFRLRLTRNVLRMFQARSKFVCRASILRDWRIRWFSVFPTAASSLSYRPMRPLNYTIRTLVRFTRMLQSIATVGLLRVLLPTRLVHFFITIVNIKAVPTSAWHLIKRVQSNSFIYFVLLYFDVTIFFWLQKIQLKILQKSTILEKIRLKYHKIRIWLYFNVF